MELLQQQLQKEQQLREERKQEIMRLFESSTEDLEQHGFDGLARGAGDELELVSVDQCEAAAAARESDNSRQLRREAAAADVKPAAGGGVVDVVVRTEAEYAANAPVKRRRGRPPKNGMVVAQQPLTRQQPHVEEEEDVCFICFDGGKLVLCDRRGCPKAYHPACIKRDEAFFRSRAKWNCGWHICSTCQKAACYMCYTCTYSLCKNCTKGADYVCIRGSKGLCGTCMRTIMLIENIRQGPEDTVQVDFDDKTSWEYLFKVYWILLKEKLSLTLDEVTQAKNPWIESSMAPIKHLPEVYRYNGQKRYGLDNYNKYRAADSSNGRKSKKQAKTEEEVQSGHINLSHGTPFSSGEGTEWASKELLEFVAHMKNGNTSMLSPFEVQELLLEYIRRNNLRDPNQRCQILCDSMLFSLFGKAIVGHIEMLKLLESHFIVKEKPNIDGSIQGPTNGAVASQMDIDLNNHNGPIPGNDRRRKTRRKIDERVPQVNLDDYAAIDVHNIKLIYLDRNLMDKLVFNVEKFHERVAGSFIRIKVSSSDQKQDVYRLVQVIGSNRVSEPDEGVSKSANIKLEIMNLGKTEVVSLDEISNQEFSETECRMLRQSITCGLIKRLTVGEVQKKALALQEVRVNEWLEKEISRLNHLRDRASEKGQRKDLRECVEKLQLLNSPEERKRRMSELPEIHVDRSMDPNYEVGDKPCALDLLIKASDSCSSKKRKASVSPGRGSDESRVTRSRSHKKQSIDIDRETSSQTNVMNGSSRNHAHEASVMSSWKTESVSGVASEISPSPLSTGTEQSVNDVEIYKIWHYQDPSGKVQGPFNMTQLRKWNESGHFPLDLKIWRTDETREDSILLTDALNGRYTKQPVVPPKEILAASVGIDQHNKQDDSKSVVTDVNIGEESGIPKDSSPGFPGNVNNEAIVSSALGSSLSSHDSATETATTGEENPENVLHGPNLPNDSNASPVQASSQVNENLECSQNNGSATPHQPNEGQTNGGCSDKQDSGEGHANQLSGQNWITPLPVVSSSSDSDPSTLLKPLDKSLETPQKNKEIDFFELPCTVTKVSNEEFKNQVAESNQSLSLNIPAQDSGPSWSTTSAVVSCGPPVNEVTGKWGMYSAAPAKLVDEWDSTLASASSLKPTDVGGDHAATPTSGPLMHSSTSVQVPDASSWQAMVTEANDFSALAEESVSDLLAEVEAMESLNGLPSPTSMLKSAPELADGSKDDCFSPVEVFSPGPTPAKSDAFSSTGDLQVSSQAAIPNEPQGLPNVEKISRRHSPVRADVVEDRKHSNASVSHWKQGSTSTISGPAHPRPSWDAGPAGTTWVAPSVTEGPYGALHGSASVGWAGVNHGNAPLDWDPRNGTALGNVNVNLGGVSGNPGILGNQPRYGSGGSRYSSPRDRVYQGSDVGFNRGRSGWSKQYSSGGSGGSYRQPPKGQRVCKFYENGYCKKGANCSYLHP